MQFHSSPAVIIQDFTSKSSFTTILRRFKESSASKLKFKNCNTVGLADMRQRFRFSKEPFGFSNCHRLATCNGAENDSELCGFVMLLSKEIRFCTR